jgi:formylmethanofuran--tetrahydromethanopterin N-formyltransferase
MQIKGVAIEDTFAEAFKMYGTRVLVTGANARWADHAAQAATGFATSVIGCGCEGGIEEKVPPAETPDCRPGVNILLFTVSREEMARQLQLRIGQCIMTAPTAACFNNLMAGEKVVVGGKLRFFGDGFQKSKLVGERRFWRIPVMEGEFLVEESFGVQKAVGGGNFLILGEDPAVTLAAAERAVRAMKQVKGVIMPFPGGIVRSGSKVGSRYRFLAASTNTDFCPPVRGRVKSQLPEGVNSVLEIVVDGLTLAAVQEATRAGVLAACIPGVKKITAGNYGGSLGQYQIHLHDVLR